MSQMTNRHDDLAGLREERVRLVVRGREDVEFVSNTADGY